MRLVDFVKQYKVLHASHAAFAAIWQSGSKMPALRLRHQEIAKHLHPRNRLQFLGVYKKSIERDGIGFSEQLHQTAILLDQVIRQQRNADAALAGTQYPEHGVDGEGGRARSLAVSPDLDQPAPVLQIIGDTA